MRLSRSKVELFLQCQRCFYLDIRHGVRRPSSPPFSLNLAVDHLLKREFDVYRQKQEIPPLLVEAGLEMIPFKDDRMDDWRNNFKGIAYKIGGLELFGAVDDVWVDKNKKLVVVDYKASASKNFTGLAGSSWKEQYKRQLSFYQWLLKNNNFVVSEVGYFVYCNAILSRDRFRKKLEFDCQIYAYECDDSWIEPTLTEINKCLAGLMPKAGNGCEYCKYAFGATSNLGFEF